MVTKAIIQEVLKPTAVRVRIPILNKIEDVVGSTPNSELPISALCSLPNFIINPRVGDVVIVAFEEDNLSKPIILGYLSTSGFNGSLIDIKCDELTVAGAIRMNEDIIIGDVTYENLHTLKGMRDNLLERLTKINMAIDELAEKGASLSRQVSFNSETIDDISKRTSNTEKTVSNLSTRMSSTETKVSNIETDYIKKYPAILGTNSYGDKTKMDKISPTEGQIYLLLK